MQTPIFAVFACLLLGLTSYSLANVTGTDTQSFNPSHNQLDFVSVESARLLEPGLSVLSTHLILQETAARTREYQQQLTVGFGLLPSLNIGLSYARQIATSHDSLERRYSDQSEILLGAKSSLFRTPTRGIALLLSTNLRYPDDNPYTGKHPLPTLNIELAVDRRWRQLVLALNGGYRFRNPGEELVETQISPTKDQLIGSAGASYVFTSIDSQVAIEAFGSRAARLSGSPSQQSTTAEVVCGGKHVLWPRVTVQAGWGQRLSRATFSPRHRIFLGLTGTVGPSGRKTYIRFPTVERGRDQRTRQVFQDIEVLTGLPPQRGESVLILDSLFYSFGKNHKHRSRDLATAGKLATFLKQSPPFRHLTIVGHTHSLGSPDDRMARGRSQAQDLKNILVDTYKLDGHKMTIESRGSRTPKFSNGNYQGRAQNERLEIIILR